MQPNSSQVGGNQQKVGFKQWSKHFSLELCTGKHGLPLTRTNPTASSNNLTHSGLLSPINETRGMSSTSGSWPNLTRRVHGPCISLSQIEHHLGSALPPFYLLLSRLKKRLEGRKKYPPPPPPRPPPPRKSKSRMHKPLAGTKSASHSRENPSLKNHPLLITPN